MLPKILLSIFMCLIFISSLFVTANDKIDISIDKILNISEENLKNLEKNIDVENIKNKLENIKNLNEKLKLNNISNKEKVDISKSIFKNSIEIFDKTIKDIQKKYPDTLFPSMDYINNLVYLIKNIEKLNPKNKKKIEIRQNIEISNENTVGEILASLTNVGCNCVSNILYILTHLLRSTLNNLITTLNSVLTPLNNVDLIYSLNSLLTILNDITNESMTNLANNLTPENICGTN